MDEEGYGGMEPVVCGAAPTAGERVAEGRDAGDDDDGDEWEDVPEGEEGEEEEEEEEDNAMPPAAMLEIPAGMCRAPLDLMKATAERCWRSCALVVI